MKKLTLFLAALSMGVVLMAQPGKMPVKPKTTITPAPALKNITDSASYAIGLSVASFYKQQGIKNIKSSLVTQAINDVMGNKKTLFDETVANNVMNQYMSQLQAQKAQPRIDSGNAFLAKNKLRPGVKTTASGLQYEVIQEGTGIKPTSLDTFVCHYKGSLLDGTVFDASANRGTPLEMAVSNVIAGWQEGLSLMGVGSKFKLYIPYNLGYGAFDYGPIPGGSLLIFEMELLDVKKKQ